ncbi:peptidoglycan endopeptidase [Novosphingobium flavum]|uniref:Peptidoglycan endopeptidase n=1 Tax=Novosphingobium flavum TaxID=1778672 RepID=A0A7X1FQG3_9SPHN|nr:peptidoglycan endopeptidase [Novosphingobium flavum]MBC2665043.1 peptidoglycan endopeptidase [Novosphingobium flavum]
MEAAALAAAAEALVGCRFRLHGRAPETGLDCIGLLSAALAGMGRPAAFPTGYRLRTGSYAALPLLARDHGFAAASGPDEPGDVLFVRPGPGQLHLVIAARRAGWFVEAHAGLGRVAVRPGPLGDILVQRWRMTAQA